MEQIEKKLSCGIIFTTGTYFLGCLPTGRTNVYDIPKGEIGENEDPIDCAIRECEEETGLKISKEDLEDIGRFNYNKNKDLHLFVHFSKRPFDIQTLTCRSTFELHGRQVPEIKGYAWIPIKQHRLFYPGLSKIIENLFL